MSSPSTIQLTLFAVAWAIGIYGINCLIARGFKPINPKQAILHIVAMAMLGLVGEVTIGSLYTYLFHKPLWNYTVLPIHNAYTSQYAMFLWGIYGFHLYLLHGTLKKRKISSIHQLAFIFCLEAILIEACVNITFRLSFGRYIYYYFPSDLWHFTSVQTLPFYLAAGYVIIMTFRKFEMDSSFYSLMSAAFVFVLAFLT